MVDNAAYKAMLPLLQGDYDMSALRAIASVGACLAAVPLPVFLSHPASAASMLPLGDPTIEEVFPRPRPGIVTELSAFKVAFVELWLTDKNAKNTTIDPYRTGWVAVIGGEYKDPETGAIRYISDQLFMHLPANNKAPDIRQRQTDKSSSWVANKSGRFSEDTAGPDSASEDGAVSDLMIEAIVIDPETGKFALADVFGTIARRKGLYNPVIVPDLFADTNGDGEIGAGDILYSLVDMTVWLEFTPTVALGQTFDIVDGQVAELPGMWFSSAPFTFDPDMGFTTTGLFSSSAVAGPRSPFSTSGGAVAAGLHSFTATPEPGSWALLIAGFGILGAALRRRRGVPELAVRPCRLPS